METTLINVRTTDITATELFGYIHGFLGEDADVAVRLIAEAAEKGVSAWPGDDVQPVRFTIARGHLDGKTVYSITTA